MGKPSAFWAADYLYGKLSLIIGRPQKYSLTSLENTKHLEDHSRKKTVTEKYVVHKLSQTYSADSISSVFVDCQYFPTKDPIGFLGKLQHITMREFVLIVDVSPPETAHDRMVFDSWVDAFLSLSLFCQLQFKSVLDGGLRFVYTVNALRLQIDSSESLDKYVGKESVGNFTYERLKSDHDLTYFKMPRDEYPEDGELLSRLMRQHIFDLHEEKERLRTNIRDLNGKMDAQATSLEVSERKRSGHWDKLVKAEARSKKLEEDVHSLQTLLDHLANSRSFALGHALVQSKRIGGLIRLPRELFNALRWNRLAKPYLTHPAMRDVVRKTGYGKRRTGSRSMPAVLPSAQKNRPSASSIEHMPALGWLRPPNQAGKLTVMSVCDEFTMACMEQGFRNVSPRPDNWNVLKDLEKPDFLFVESAWAGNLGSWQYRVGTYSDKFGEELDAMVNQFQSDRIPTIFWNKEDPFHFEKFIEAASKFDIILTTDEDSISRYAAQTDAKIACLPFFAIAEKHNPIGSSERLARPCFGGSFYKNRFSERQADMVNLMRVAQKYDLDIYDRNFGLGKPDMEFPKEFQGNILGRLPFSKMNIAYRAYRTFLNVNSVTVSRTMLSRRIFELLASGTPVVSTPSAAIDNFFGSDIVFQVSTTAQMADAISLLMTDDVEWRRRSLAGIRCVHSAHTFNHNVDRILELTGLRSDARDIAEPLVHVVVTPQTQAELDVNIEDFNRQTYKRRELVVIARSPDLSAPTSDCTFIPLNRASISENLKRCAGDLNITNIACFSPKFLYGKYHIQDLVIAMTYSKAAVVGKDMTDGDPYAYVNDLQHDTCLFDWGRLCGATFDLTNVFDTGELSNVTSKGLNMYCGDNANIHRYKGQVIYGLAKRRLVLSKIEV